MPRPQRRPSRAAGSGLPQPAFSAARRSTPRSRSPLSRVTVRSLTVPGDGMRSRRRASGSRPMVCASSSRNDSRAKTVEGYSTDRQAPVGTGASSGA